MVEPILSVFCRLSSSNIVSDFIWLAPQRTQRSPRKAASRSVPSVIAVAQLVCKPPREDAQILLLFYLVGYWPSAASSVVPHVEFAQVVQMVSPVPPRARAGSIATISGTAVRIYHFVSQGWRDRQGRDVLAPAALAADLEFLLRAALKVDTIREDLGKVG